MPNNALTKCVFHLEEHSAIAGRRRNRTYINQFFPLSLQEILHRDASRFRYDPGNVGARNAIVEHSDGALGVAIAVLAIFVLRQLLLQLRDRRESETTSKFVLALALGDLKLVLRLFKARLDILDAFNASTFWKDN